MLRIAEHWADSNVGRQRTGNEDSYFVRSPLFVVADGMGGAQAGEVASRMAVEAFEPDLPDARPEEALVQIVDEANRRIHDRSVAESALSGMGTTVTAAYVAEDEVVLAHVGDSRAYLLRGRELKRLTRDHSLVEELIERGKLTEEQAESHPQRSVITRSVGPEPAVRVDTERVAARNGDVFLVCSDGLTSMVREADVRQILTEGASLSEAGRRLIAAANEAGGRDNITVILFRLEDVGAARGSATTVEAAQDATAEQPTRAGEAAPATADVAAAVRAADEEADRTGTRGGTVMVAVPVPPKRTAPLPDDAAGRRPATAPKRRRLRLPVAAVITAVVLALLLTAGWMATRAVYFLGVDDDGRTVAIFRGVPYDLPFGIQLYERYAGSGVTIDAVPARRRNLITEHELRSLDDAENLVIELERGRIAQ
jgi:serine/threonine protein phosphatase PrpC